MFLQIGQRYKSFQHFTNSFPHYQLFVLKWWQNVLGEIQDGVPLKLKNNVQHPNTEALPTG
jgi:hypothetical protein